MKKVISLLLALLIVFVSGGNVSQAMLITSDYMAPWAEEEVGKAIENKLVPESMQKDYLSTINREEFCILAIRMIEARAGKSIEEVLSEAGKKIAPYGSFSDCDTREVRAAKTLGITEGTSPTTFSPKMKLTREQAAKFLTTTAIACGEAVDLTEPDYADNNEIADWAKPYTGYLRKMGVLQGVDGNRFNPKGSYQRQQAFMTIYRLWKVVPNVNPMREMSLEEISRLLDNSPYDSDYKAFFEGERSFWDGTRVPAKIEMFYSPSIDDETIRMDSFLDGNRDSVRVYHATADMTFVRQIMSGEYAESNEGYHLQLPYLTQLGFLEDMESDSVINMVARVVMINGEKYVEVEKEDTDGGKYFDRYSLKYKFPVKHEYRKGDIFYKVEFKSIDEDITLVDSIFDEEAITNGNYDTEDVDFVSSLVYDPYPKEFTLRMEGVYKEPKNNYESPTIYTYTYETSGAKLTKVATKMGAPATYKYSFTADKTMFLGAGDWEDLGAGNKLDFNYLSKSEYERLTKGQETMRFTQGYTMLDGEKKIVITVIKLNGDVSEYYYDADTKIPYKYVSKQFNNGPEVEVTRVELNYAK